MRKKIYVSIELLFSVESSNHNRCCFRDDRNPPFLNNHPIVLLREIQISERKLPSMLFVIEVENA